jgi:hypothetical protein
LDGLEKKVFLALVPENQPCMDDDYIEVCIWKVTSAKISDPYW